MKLAVTIWNGRVSPVFDVCRTVLLVTLEDGAVVDTALEPLDPLDGERKLERLVELAVELLICGAISEPLQQRLQARGLRVLGFVAGAVEEVLRAFVAGELPGPAHAMPGCGGGQHRYRGGAGVGRGEGHGAGRGEGRGRQEATSAGAGVRRRRRGGARDSNNRQRHWRGRDEG